MNVQVWESTDLAAFELVQQHTLTLVQEMGNFCVTLVDAHQWLILAFGDKATKQRASPKRVQFDTENQSALRPAENGAGTPTPPDVSPVAVPAPESPSSTYDARVEQWKRGAIFTVKPQEDVNGIRQHQKRCLAALTKPLLTPSLAAGTKIRSAMESLVAGSTAVQPPIRPEVPQPPYSGLSGEAPSQDISASAKVPPNELGNVAPLVSDAAANLVVSERQKDPQWRSPPFVREAVNSFRLVQPLGDRDVETVPQPSRASPLVQPPRVAAVAASRFNARPHPQHSISDGDDGEEEDGPVDLLWDDTQSINVFIAQEGSYAMSTLRRRQRKGRNFIAQGHPSSAASITEDSFAMGTIGAAKGSFIWEVEVRSPREAREDGGSGTGLGCEDARPLSLIMIGMASRHYTGLASGCPTYFFRSDGYLSCRPDGGNPHRYGKPFASSSGSVVTVHLDLTRWELSFFVDGVSQGVAFRFTAIDDPEPLFPVVVFGGEGDTALLQPPSVTLPSTVTQR